MPLYGDDKKLKISGDDDLADFLESKIVPGDSISITKETTSGVEQLRIAAIVSDVFSTDYDEATNSLSTSSTTAQDAGVSVTVPLDGDYVVFFDAEIRATNNSAITAISLSGPNNTTELASSYRRNGGNKQQTSFTLQVYSGLSAGDVITGLYRKFSGGGSAQLDRRSIFLQRSG